MVFGIRLVRRTNTSMMTNYSPIKLSTKCHELNFYLLR